MYTRYKVYYTKCNETAYNFTLQQLTVLQKKFVLHINIPAPWLSSELKPYLHMLLN